jgi:hypothetical protein
MAKVRLPWKHRRIQGEQIVTLDCGCKYHCQDKEMQLVNLCLVHERPGYWAYYKMKRNTGTRKHINEIIYKPIPGYDPKFWEEINNKRDGRNHD